jgi:hypothetical protein
MCETSALLDAVDGNSHRRLRLDEHAHVQDAVLLRADELLAVVQEDALGERILDDELGHRARLVDLASGSRRRCGATVTTRQRLLLLRSMRR